MKTPKKLLNQGEIFLELEGRFLNEAKLTKEQILIEYFPHENLSSYLLSKKLVGGLISRMKSRMMNRYQLYFGNVNSAGEFGVATEFNEVAYVVQRYINSFRGNVRRATFLIDYAKSKNIIASNVSFEYLTVPRLVLDSGSEAKEEAKTN